MKSRKIELWTATAIYAVHVYIIIILVLHRMNHLPYMEIVKKQFQEIFY